MLFRLTALSWSIPGLICYLFTRDHETAKEMKLELKEEEEDVEKIAEEIKSEGNYPDGP